MVDFFLPFLIGYAAARILSFMLTANKETSKLTVGILLKWDNDIFGWRPISAAQEVDRTGRFMIANPIDPEAIEFLNSTRS